MEELFPNAVGDRLRKAFNAALVEYGAIGEQVDEEEKDYREELWLDAVVELIKRTS